MFASLRSIFFVPSAGVKRKLSRLVSLPTCFLFLWARVFMLHEAPIYEGLVSTHNPGWCRGAPRAAPFLRPSRKKQAPQVYGSLLLPLEENTISARTR